MAEEKGGKTGILTFSMQIGLVRESVTVEGGELTLSTLKEIACAFVDRKVSHQNHLGVSLEVLEGWWTLWRGDCDLTGSEMCVLCDMLLEACLCLCLHCCLHKVTLSSVLGSESYGATLDLGNVSTIRTLRSALFTPEALGLTHTHKHTHSHTRALTSTPADIRGVLNIYLPTATNMIGTERFRRCLYSHF